jgi:LysR family transcriptional regulator, mexEF-oprN operon transcriptional activator
MMTIDHANLGRLDLNLLVALDALLTERSVTRAASRVGLGQSAMSYNLARLRQLFGDEILTRGPNGMRPTPRALALTEPLRGALAQVQALTLPEKPFDPATADRTFRIGLSDAMEVRLAPSLMAHLCAVAPGVRLQLRPADRLEILQELDGDRLDLGIGVFTEGQTHHKQRRLFSDGFLCVFNAEQVGVSPPISIQEYVRLPHILTSSRGDAHGMVDTALEKLALQRRVVLITPRFLAVSHILRSAPVIATMPAGIARFIAAPIGLSVSPVPVELSAVTTSLLWHSSYDRDPAHQWLRRTVRDLARRMVNNSEDPISESGSNHEPEPR